MPGDTKIKKQTSKSGLPEEKSDPRKFQFSVLHLVPHSSLMVQKAFLLRRKHVDTPVDEQKNVQGVPYLEWVVRSNCGEKCQCPLNMFWWTFDRTCDQRKLCSDCLGARSHSYYWCLAMPSCPVCCVQLVLSEAKKDVRNLMTRECLDWPANLHYLIKFSSSNLE